MSCFFKQTKHPHTGEWENAEWLDDHFGKHIYGVRFPSSGLIVNADVDALETREDVTPTHDWEGRFQRYKREFTQESDPEPYIHVGLNHSCQFSDLIHDIRTEIEAAEKRGAAAQMENTKKAIALLKELQDRSGDEALLLFEEIITPTKDKGEDVSSNN